MSVGQMAGVGIQVSWSVKNAWVSRQVCWSVS